MAARPVGGPGLRRALCAVAVATTLTSCGWATFRHDAARTGVNSSETSLGPGAATRLTRRWSVPVGSPVESSPSISPTGVLAVGAGDGMLHAYDHLTGASKWTAATDGATPSSPTWSTNGTAYVGATNGRLYAFSGSDGSLLWSETTGGATSSPVVDGSTVLVGSADGTVDAFPAAGGPSTWATQTGASVESSVALANDAFVGNDSGNVDALDPSSGAIQWTYGTGGAVRSTPAVANGVVYVGSADDDVYAIDATHGTLDWKFATGGAVDSSPAVDNGVVVVAGEDGQLRALDASTGAQRWSVALGSGASSSPAVADGVVYVGTRAGALDAFNEVNGSSIWSQQTGGPVLSSPAEQDGVVYAGSDDGTLYAFGAPDPCSPVVSRITCENSLPGTPQSSWDVTPISGSTTIQGFTTDISTNVGGTVHFKISTPATAYHIEIYRIGYYGGDGARYEGTVHPSVSLPQNQPPCLTDAATNLVDCGNWAESASWTVPTTAVSGVYVAKLVRDDSTKAASQIVFVVRDDSSHADLLFQTSDTTWEAYNGYGGASLYSLGHSPGRAYAVSYDRPLVNRGAGVAVNQFFGDSEYPMVRFLEANGYDVTYASDVDTDRYGANLLHHKVFLSVGHDEYWTAGQRASVEAARAAGVSLGFFSGDEIYRKARWAPSIDPSATPYRTLVDYKETMADAKIDPSPTWTGLWRDHRFSPPSDGGRPENALSGTSYYGDTESCCQSFPLTVSAEEGRLRLWRDTSLATLAPGTSATVGDRIIGYEYDADVDNGYRPAGEIDLSTTTIGSGGERGTHHITMYRSTSRSLVFSVGTLQWGWSLDGHADGGTTPDVRVQQATVNVLADMGVQPYSLQGGLVPANGSTDTTPPTSTITSPAPGATVPADWFVTVTGTATDAGGGQVGGVEVSADGGATWHPATGRTTWTYTFISNRTSGPITIESRATDDSGNVETPGPGVTVEVTPRTCPCSLFGTGTPPTPDSGSATPIEVGAKIVPDTSGTISAVRFYKSAANTGPHVVSLWTSTGTLLATATSANETASGWQDVAFPQPVPVTAGTEYVASYHASVGHTADDLWYSVLPAVFYDPTGVDETPLHLADPLGPDGPSVYATGATSTFPTTPSRDENYWVDVVFEP